MSAEPIEHNNVDRFIGAVELTAGAFLAAVTAITFVSVFLRYLFAWSIPDAYDLSALLLGIIIFWGIAGASYRGDHITVDLLWGALPPSLQRALDLFGNLVTFGAIATLTWMMATKVRSTYSDHVLTFDLRQPVWVYYFIAWLGLAAATVLLVIRLYRLIAAPDRLTRKSHSDMID